LNFAQDLARRVGLALENARLFQQARAAIQAREEFLSVAAHELRTPITSLRGQVQLMIRQLSSDKEPDPARLKRAFQVMEDQSNKLARLIAQLLDVSRLQAGKLLLECETVDLTALAEEVVSRVGTAATRTIDLQAAPGVTATVDPLRLEQVLINLLD